MQLLQAGKSPLARFQYALATHFWRCESNDGNSYNRHMHIHNIQYVTMLMLTEIVLYKDIHTYIRIPYSDTISSHMYANHMCYIAGFERVNLRIEDTAHNAMVAHATVYVRTYIQERD